MNPDREAGHVSDGVSVLVGLAAIVFSALHFASDLMEFAHGGFSTQQLTLTLVAEAAIPFIVIGLYVVQRPAIAQLGLVGAVLYAYSFIFFTGTVVFALVNGTRDWNALTDQLGGWVSIHGALMVLAGMAFGVAIIRTGVLPRWTGAMLIAGIVLVAASSGLPDVLQTASAGVRDLAFAGMGASILLTRRARVPRGSRAGWAQADAGSTPSLGPASSTITTG